MKLESEVSSELGSPALGASKKRKGGKNREEAKQEVIYSIRVAVVGNVYEILDG